MNLALNFEPSQKNTNDNAASCEVLYITECSTWGELGYKTVSSAFHSVLPIYWSPDMPKPDLNDWHGDWIISFKSDLVLPRSILERAKKGAINFHPCPPKYRGLGGYWWALHNGDDVFGVTCHHMNERIDHGDIIKTESFPIWRGETVESLKHRAALYSLGLLNETLSNIISEKPLDPSGEKWGQHLYTHKELTIAQAQEALDAVIKNDLVMTTERGGRYFNVAQSTCGMAS
ncbi:MAG: formyltransferase family protein [Alphaproteobacteria bacterium]|nr:formyltransferase family protein [Alphaproteobacteria bacterium]